MKLKAAPLLLYATLLAACGGGHHEGNEAASAAVVATRTPDYSSGAVSLVDTQAPYAADNAVASSETSDIVVRADGDHYFLLKRYGTNQILRYDAADPGTPVWTYSTNATEGEESNPADLVVASPTKAYLLRYGAGALWVVNPSATSEAGFKTGKIDLSEHDADGVPEMTAGLIKDGKLYVLLQRLQNFDATQEGEVLVIDTASDTVVETIALPVRNPGTLVAVPGTSEILVAASGGYGSFPDYVPPYDGGLARIDTGSGTATLALDDGDATTHPYGQLGDLAVVDAHRAYFVGSSDYGDTGQTLYRFDPGAATITPVAVSGYAGKDLGALAVDPEGKLWIGRTSDEHPGLTVLGYAGGAETVEAALIDTVLTPINIDFVERED